MGTLFSIFRKHVVGAFFGGVATEAALVLTVNDAIGLIFAETLKAPAAGFSECRRIFVHDSQYLAPRFCGCSFVAFDAEQVEDKYRAVGVNAALLERRQAGVIDVHMVQTAEIFEQRMFCLFLCVSIQSIYLAEYYFISSSMYFLTPMLLTYQVLRLLRSTYTQLKDQTKMFLTLSLAC